ncbi:hypothetical protein C8R44DRAFT_684501 [Mycena epipterygia]|nr:hypothetical protein C8R44DRAFT_684501 [Mycena epipterygia]
MPPDDIEHGKEPDKPEKSELGDELGSTKLWTVYISEAEKYDKALVESWRSDMNGMLIFAGLFSGSLTAFLVESYKNLTPDSGDTAVILLNRISVQLSGAANGTHSIISTPPPFSPPATALLCNALWFISLTLSLTCALVATLVEQWAREFLHRADIRSAPADRARIFSYLYYGLKRYKMHCVVEVIPLLLHASLVLFFGGLVAFLAPVNKVIMILGAALFGVVVVVYLFLTILPLISFDCPYRTPLSGTLWRAFHALPYQVFRWHKSEPSTAGPDTGNIIMAISRRATKPSEERSVRDRRALVWTLKSLADDDELEPFVESIPDVLWGPNGKRNTYDRHISALVHDPNAQLLSRILNMLRRCESGLLTPPFKIRRQIACYKALWAISTLSGLRDSSQQMEAPLELPFPSGSVDSAEVKHYMLSALALTRWNAFCCLDTRLRSTLDFLGQSLSGHPSNLKTISDLLRDIHQHPIFGSHPFPLRRVCADHLREIERNNVTELPSTQTLIQRLLESVGTFRADIPHIILFDYLYEVTKIGKTPYQFDRTRETIILQESPISSAALLFLERVFNAIVSNHLETLRTAPGFHLLDKILGILISFWRPRLNGPVSIPNGLIKYLDQREFNGAVLHVVWQFGPNLLWSCITAAFSDGRLLASGTTPGRLQVSIDDLLTAFWRLYSLPARIMPELTICESALEAVSNSASSFASPSVTAMIKANIIDSLLPADRISTNDEELISRLSHPILPPETAHRLPILYDNSSLGGDLKMALHGRTIEARFQVVSELLEHCSSFDSRLPYNVKKTLAIVKPLAPSVLIHAAHQMRFVKSIRGIFRAGRDPEILDAVMNFDVFDVYAPPGHGASQKLPRTSEPSQAFPWMDNSAARELMKAFLFEYEETLITSASSPVIVARVKALLQGIDTLHPRTAR